MHGMPMMMPEPWLVWCLFSIVNISNKTFAQRSTNASDNTVTRCVCYGYVGYDRVGFDSCVCYGYVGYEGVGSDSCVCYGYVGYDCVGSELCLLWLCWL